MSLPRPAFVMQDVDSRTQRQKIPLMAIGIRTQDLRKVYTSAPPLGAAGGFIARADAKGSKQPAKTQPGVGWRTRNLDQSGRGETADRRRSPAP